MWSITNCHCVMCAYRCFFEEFFEWKLWRGWSEHVRHNAADGIQHMISHYRLRIGKVALQNYHCGLY